MDSMDALRFVGSLALVCALIWGLAIAVSKTKFGKFTRYAKSAGGTIAVEDVLFLDPKHRLLSVRWQNENYLLLLSSQSGAQLLASCPANMENMDNA